jgi:flagellar hook-length control protein FliK
VPAAISSPQEAAGSTTGEGIPAPPSLPAAAQSTDVSVRQSPALVANAETGADATVQEDLAPPAAAASSDETADNAARREPGESAAAAPAEAADEAIDSSELLLPPREPEGASLSRMSVASAPPQPLQSSAVPPATLPPHASSVPLIELFAELTRQANLRVLAQGRQIQLQLEPRDLGRLEMALERDNQGRVFAHVRVETEAARVAVESRLQSLGEALEASGLALADLQVSVGNRDADDTPPPDREGTESTAKKELPPPLLAARPVPPKAAHGRLDIVI